MKTDRKLINQALAAYKKQLEIDAQRLLGFYADGKFLYEKKPPTKHYGPGLHSGTGTGQEVHGHGEGNISSNQLSLFVAGTKYGNIEVHPNSSVKFHPGSYEAWKTVFGKDMPDNLKEQLLAAYGMDDPKIETIVDIDAYYNDAVLIKIGYYDTVNLDYDGNPKPIGNASRTVRKDDGGWIGVHHGLFELKDDYQNRGWGTSVYQRSESFYLNNGVSRITLMADLTVGSYAWARLGFDFETPRVSEVFNGSFKQWLYRQKKVPYSDIPSDDTFLTAWEISTFTYKGQRMGREFLLGRDWDAVKYLDPDDPGYQVGQLYWEEKAKNK